MAIGIFTTEEAAKLRYIIDLVERSGKSEIFRRPRITEESEQPTSPEIHVARTPLGGIPRLQEASGTSQADQPGYTECDIYRILEGDTTSTLIPIDVFPKRIYNIFHEDIGGNRWVVVVKTKAGHWVVGGLIPFPSVTDTGTGTGIGPNYPAGTCQLAALMEEDCLFATDGEQDFYLVFDPPSGRWRSISAGTGTGTGFPAEQYIYPGGSGAIEFWYSAGSIHLSVGGLELLNCGDGCFTGGPLTGHTNPGTGGPACSADTFTICVECAECPNPQTLIATSCCPAGIPDQLTLTFLACGGGASACVGQSTPMVWNGATSKWEGAMTCGGTNWTFKMNCNVATWELDVTCISGEVNDLIGVSVVCDPFTVTFNGGTWADCCNLGGFSVKVTE